MRLIRQWLQRRRMRRETRRARQELERRHLDLLNRLLRETAEADDPPPLAATHRLIDGPVNDDTPYFAAMKGWEVHVRRVDGLYACGMIIRTGLPFDGWKLDRLEGV